jgi:hypothetical protein
MFDYAFSAALTLVTVPLSYDVRFLDTPLIEAAIRLGDWLAAQGATSDQQRLAIQDVQRFLRALPQNTENIDAEYGLRLNPIDDRDPDAVARAWGVGITPGAFELSSSKTRINDPNPFDRVDCELQWSLRLGERNKNSNKNVEMWIAELCDPRKLIVPGYILSVATYYDDDYEQHRLAIR